MPWSWSGGPADGDGDGARPWRALSGVGRYWAQNELTDEGRRRFHLARGHVPAVVEPGPDYEQEYEDTYLFLVEVDPWRLVIMGTAQQRHRRLVAWADNEETWVEISGDPPKVVPHPHGATHGDAGLGTLLRPAWLGRARALGACSEEADGEIRLDGDIVGRAMLAGGISGIGLDELRCRFDERLGVVTDFAGFIDGEMAVQASLRDVCVLLG